MHALCRYTIWALLKANVFGVVADTNEESLQIAILCLRAELIQWYDNFARENPGVPVSRLGDLTPKMLGSFDSPKLKTKAMETFWILRFLIGTLQKFRQTLGPDFDRLRSASEILFQYVTILKGHGPRLPPDVLQASVGDQIQSSETLHFDLGETVFLRVFLRHGVSTDASLPKHVNCDTMFEFVTMAYDFCVRI